MSRSQVSGWPIALFAIPFAAVLFGIVMISSVSLYPDDVVADDYYKDGMAINQQLKADERARVLGLTASIDLLPEVRISIPGATDSAVRLNLHHVTDERLDRSWVLVPETDDTYSGAEPLAEMLTTQGIWYVELEGIDERWRLRARVIAPSEAFRLVPSV
mgnify:CR=1 FL=1